MENKIYSAYDNECMVYLSLEILKSLLLEENHMYIDVYYEELKKIYEDYKKYDNPNKSLLDSIHDYIDNNEQELLNRLENAFEGVL